jgi:hypothetical protein
MDPHPTTLTHLIDLSLDYIRSIIAVWSLFLSYCEQSRGQNPESIEPILRLFPNGDGALWYGQDIACWSSPQEAVITLSALGLSPSAVGAERAQALGMLYVAFLAYGVAVGMKDANAAPVLSLFERGAGVIDTDSEHSVNIEFHRFDQWRGVAVSLVNFVS